MRRRSCRRRRRNRSSRKASRCRKCGWILPAGITHRSTECAPETLIRYTPTPRSRTQPGCPEIILHGTATLALAVAERVIESEAGKDPARIERVAARFGAMVMMPSTLTVRVLAREGAVVFFEVLSGEGRPWIRDG